ncbi:unnamed protein product [Rotaria sordida]|uniref:Uncharacterized protein n=1 Tax=Rotaria sordida TaxID=392033 RepID=A0A815N7H8_9BILA|nr:unnamed protein product [Rotaria sordida]CAF1430059.1 unnamed protein product [Rotaria sordida]CAF1430215.1 unnamed protein product [Rotaria sordida]
MALSMLLTFVLDYCLQGTSAYNSLIQQFFDIVHHLILLGRCLYNGRQSFELCAFLWTEHDNAKLLLLTIISYFHPVLSLCGVYYGYYRSMTFIYACILMGVYTNSSEIGL